MLPDLLVVVLKVRDYTLWFGPPYLAALAIGAVLQMGWQVRMAAPTPEAGVGKPSPVPEGGDPPAPRVAAPAGRAGVARALWRRSLAYGLTPAALLLPGYLNGLFLLGRAGGILLVSAFMAGGTASVGGTSFCGPRPGAGPASGPAALADPVPSGDRVPGWRGRFTLAWQYFRQAVDAELQRFLLGGAVGGLIVAWAPGVWVGEQLRGATVGAALLGALLGLALPLNGGAVMPVIAALITRGAGPAAVVALLVAAPLLNWWDLRPLARQYPWRCLLVYVSLGLLGASVLGFALAQLPGSARLSSY